MRRAQFIVVFASFVVLGLNSGASGVVIPSQLRDYQVDKVIFGLTFLTFSGGYLVGSLASSTIARRLGDSGALRAGSAALAAATLAIGAHPTFVLLAALNAVSGAGCGLVDAGLNAYVSTFADRVRLLNRMHAGFGLGAFAGPLIATGFLVSGHPWYRVYLLLGALAAPIVVGASALRSRHGLDASRPADSPLARSPAAAPVIPILRLRSLWWAAGFLWLYVGAEVTVGNWGFAFLTQHRGQTAALAGWVVGGYWLGITLGRLVIGTLAHRAGVGAVGMVYGCLAAVAVAVLVAGWAPGPVLTLGGFGLLGFFLGPLFPTTVAVLPRLVPDGSVPGAIAILVGVSVAGAGSLPYLAGALTQLIGLGAFAPYLLVLTVAQILVWRTLAGRMSTAPVATN